MASGSVDAPVKKAFATLEVHPLPMDSHQRGGTYHGDSWLIGGHVLKNKGWKADFARIFIPTSCMIMFVFLWTLIPQGSDIEGPDGDYTPIVIAFVTIASVYSTLLLPGVLYVFTGQTVAQHYKAVTAGFSVYTFISSLSTYLVRQRGTRTPLIIITLPAAIWTIFLMPYMICIYRRVPNSELRKRPIVIAVLKSFLGAVSFFCLGFGFSAFFVVLQNSVMYQIVALIVFQTIGNIIFKMILINWTVSVLRHDETKKTAAATALSLFYEFLAELFLSFSFPSVQHWSVLVFACLYEVLLFSFHLRTAYGLGSVPVIRDSSSSRSRSNRDNNGSSQRSSNGQGTSVVDDGGPPPLKQEMTSSLTRSDKSSNALGQPRINAYTVAGTPKPLEGYVISPHIVRVASKGGGVLICELLAGICFIMFFTTFCYGPAADNFLAGGDSCDLQSFLTPSLFTLFGMTLHIIVYSVISKRIWNKCGFVAIKVALSVCAENRVSVIGALGTSLGIVLIWFWKKAYVFHYLSTAEYS